MANDADGAAFAELYHGAFVGCKNAVLLTLGTGLGGGIIVNGKIFRGGLNHGVELGHAYLIYGGKPCSCGNSGCAEAYCSASALASLAVNAMHKYPESLVYPKSNGDADAIDAKFLVDCAKAADPIALNIWNKYLDYLSSFCASIFNILDPEVLAIGGGLCGAGDFLFEPLRQLTSQKCFYKTHGNIVPAVLGNNAGIIGAAMLWNNQF